MANIRINTESIVNIVKKLEFTQDEIRALLISADKELEIAELEGWDDKSFYEFKDSFLDTRHNLMDSIKRIEEEHLPYLKKILKNTENF